MIPLTSLEQFNKLKQGNQLFLVWFSAAWCISCKHMDKQLLEDAAKEVALPFYYCDAEPVVNTCNISRFPTFIIFKGDTIIDTYCSSDTIRVFQNIRKVGSVKHAR